VLTQTLHLIDDMAAVVAECARILRPGGVLLATAPSVIRVDDEAGVGGDYWRLTEASARTLFAAAFPIDAFEVTAYGNVMTCSAFLYGLSLEEMARADLDHADPRFPLVIAIRAVKPVLVGRTLSGPPEAGPDKVRPTARMNNRAAVLVYHRVADFAPDSHALCTPPDEFRAQMAYLRDHFSPIGLEELVRAAASGCIPERAVSVTLDDGYVDHLTAASPILAALGVPATFFVNTDRVEQEHERWWDILEQIFLSGMPVPAALDIPIGAERVRASTGSAADRAQALEFLNRTAWPLDAEARRDLVANVLRWCGGTDRTRSSHRVLTASELRTLAERPGHAIGAHTVNHLALTRHSIDTKRREIVSDKLTLERLLRRPVHLFSYPYGDFDPETLAVVRDAGFRAAVTVEPRLMSAGANRLLLPRYEVTRADRGRFAERMREMFEEPGVAVMSTSLTQ
jgi:peptidoglycan/xylan/chitin deacetylase (PgdA/CDA1 family)